MKSQQVVSYAACTKLYTVVGQTVQLKAQTVTVFPELCYNCTSMKTNAAEKCFRPQAEKRGWLLKLVPYVAFKMY